MTPDAVEVRLAVETLLKAIVNQLAYETAGQFMPVESIVATVDGQLVVLVIIDRDQVFDTNELRNRIFKAGLGKFQGVDITSIFDPDSEGIIWTLVFQLDPEVEFSYGTPS